MPSPVAEYAAQVAPHLDRLRLGVTRARYVHQGPATFDLALSRTVGTSVARRSGTDSVVLSDSGREIMSQVRDLGAQAADGLTGLRFHRFDAHVAAWTAAGFTAATIIDLEPGTVHDRIEEDTNERAGLAYAALAPGERSHLLASHATLA